MQLKIVEGNKPKIDKEPEKITIEMKGALHVGDEAETEESEAGYNEN